MHRIRSRPPFGRAARAALLILVATWACGGSGESKSTPTTPPPPKPRADRVVVVTSPATTGAVKSVVGEFAVRVEDTKGVGVPGVSVDFKSQAGNAGFEFTPSNFATTDSTGVARVGVTLGIVAGFDKLLATAADVTTPAMVDITITPGPPAVLTFTPSAVRLFGAGDTASFQVRVADGYQNVIKVVPDIQPSDSTQLSVTPPATPGASGTVRALKGGVSATIAAATGGKSTTLSVSVFANSRNACEGIATPLDLFPGVPVTVADSVICVAPLIAAKYALMVFNGSTDGGTSLGTTVTGTNVVLDPYSPTRIGSRPLLSRAPALARRSSSPKLDLGFHERLLERSRSLRRLFGPARAARSFARAGSTGRIRGPSYALNGSPQPLPAVDDLVALNVADDPCTTADMRTFRVQAVGERAIVLADTGNPFGFMREDYQRFAARFDTLVYPLDVGNFDEPSDIDFNGHVAILFTRAVNELTPRGAGAFVGGFFHPRDLFPRTQAAVDVCPTSNEGEMFYMMVPDPTGVVNGNMFRVGFVDTLTTSILAHEFQHLINAGRRMYVNTAATGFEEVWLNEGLSHEAEELLFFRESGFQPRFRLTAGAILDSWPHFNAWVSDDASNFVNFYFYLSDPANHSPIALNDSLETRGATWAFLRFAADKSPSGDGAWRRFANSTTTGIGTLTFALQQDPKPVLKDFALANMTNGHPSWNFADVYNRVFVDLSYPLPYGTLKEGTAVPVAARSGSASYYRFGVPQNVQALLRFGSSAAPPDGNLKFVLMRTE